MLFDIRQLTWSEEILSAIGIAPEILSKPVPASELIGNVKGEIACRLSLDRNVAVVIGGHDQSCGALGLGAIQPGVAAYSSGTVECVTPAFSVCHLHETLRRSNLATYPHVVKDLFTTVAFNTNGGSVLRWWRDQMSQAETEETARAGGVGYELMLSQMPAEPTDILVLPHFLSTGTPHFDPQPLSAILGITLNTSKPEFLKAILEGITLEMKLNLELLEQAGVPIRELRVFGGGAKSPIWNQLKADILERPILAVEVSEAGCLGAAMLASWATCRGRDLGSLMDEWVKIGQKYEPRPSFVEKYRKKYEKYNGLYEKIKKIH